MIKSGPGQGFRCSSAWQPFPEGTQRGHFSETVHACVGKVQQCRDLPNVNCYIVSLISPSTTQTHTAPAPVYNTRCQARPDRGTCLPSPFFGPPPSPGTRLRPPVGRVRPRRVRRASEERSLTVKFHCGAEELLDVTEPSRCAYEALGTGWAAGLCAWVCRFWE